MTTPRRFFIETWGCQMNELDSQRMAGQLMQQGMLPTSRPTEADVLLLNSCSVRENAQNKVYSRIGEYRALKEDRGVLIGLCGCVAQQEGEAALERAPELDFVLGPGRVGELGQVLRRRQAGERVVATGFPEDREFQLDAISRDGVYKGMVTCIEGCDKRCTFCIVPRTRGPERCRPLAEILAEVRHLVEYGFREIELLGQTINHWREPGGEEDFADLLAVVAREPGVERLRFITSYPRDFSDRMIAAFAEHANVCPYLHLPVQSGANAVLRRMARGYTVESYLELVDRIRAARPDVVLSTDLIVGFPGETEEQFRETIALVERARFGTLFAFKYSPRPGTAAPRLDGAVPVEVAGRRLNELFAVQAEIQRELNAELVGRTFEVIVTGWGKEAGCQTGRTTCHRLVNFAAGEAPAKLGSVVEVLVEESYPHSLVGRRVDQRPVRAENAGPRFRVLPLSS
ncbi:MAG TPA: tRNA (N6-isopentenyl adenosine(37)-C2)-methylthiotransferase MiaB [Thermoanaerobaculia bacterium]|nr:tRNA (N6-isopentenyl adenosine(37)-C2)-methylthiotransferase MiaB [Thermoanaerobaculia bacterium]